MTTNLYVVVGGQFGSEAKGHVAAQLAARRNPNVVVRTGGPNAGHTVWSHLREYKLRQLPTSVVSNPAADPAIGAGSLVNIDLLAEEMELTKTDRVWVDRSATILEQRHIDQENVDPDLQWGSTKKGIGAARADRIHRTALTMHEWAGGRAVYELSNGREVVVTDVGELTRSALSWGGRVLIEAAQGYGLGLHTEYYPKTTSADCRAIDAMADVGISPWCRDVIPEVWVVVRPYPIRVAGESGPLRGETTWEELGLPDERTTVTNKVRRVGGWDGDLVRAALDANGAPSDYLHVALTMVDQVAPALVGISDLETLYSAPEDAKQELLNWVSIVEDCGAQVGMVTTSPTAAIEAPMHLHLQRAIRGMEVHQ